ncbi:MAG: helix-hairpin-helix domain-containing protein [Dehalococcoidia bacterium]|nr:helix-hairpin-helix domain-containing protein [Dehalococcoidia bacterium]
MDRADRTSFVLVVLLVGASIVGLSRLLPHAGAAATAPLEFREFAEPTAVSIVLGGEVEHPGVYTIAMTSTLADIILLAGVDPCTETPVIQVDLFTSSDEATYQRVDINHAEAWLLQSLPGIGADRATAIVAHRTSHGPFACPEEIMLVESIGEKTYEAIASLITAE